MVNFLIISCFCASVIDGELVLVTTGCGVTTGAGCTTGFGEVFFGTILVGTGTG